MGPYRDGTKSGTFCSADVPLPDTVFTWSRGLVSPSPGVPPFPGLRPDEWAGTHRRCGEFVERWGMLAHAAGWYRLRLFGVGPQTGTLRGDFCGAPIPLSVDLHEVTPEFIKLGRWKAYRHKPVKRPGMIPIREMKP